MSDHLRRLREYFGDRLFVRAATGLVATPRAEAVQPLILQIVAAMTQLSRSATAWDPATAKRIFKLGTSSYVQAIILPHLDGILRTFAPGVVLDISAPGSPGNDLEIVPLHAAASDHRQQLLFTDELVCAVDPHMAPTLDLDTFCRFEHLVMAPAPSPIHDKVDQALSDLGRSRRIAMIVSHLVGLAPLLTGQTRLAIMPARLSSLLVTWLVARPMPIAVDPYDIVMTWPQQMHGDPGHQWFRAQTEAAARLTISGARA